MTAIGIQVGTFGVCLAVLCIMAIISEGRFMIRTSLALAANWLAHIAHFALFSDPTPYVFSIFADLLTAIVILSRPAGRMQATIGWTLLAQIFIHFGYAFHMLAGGYTLEAEMRYWSWIDWIALGQIVLLGVWFGDGMGRHIFGDRYRNLFRSRRRGTKTNAATGVAQS